MIKRDRIFPTIIYSGLILVLILDSKTAFAAAQDGIFMCIKTVIPAIFPFMFLGKQLIMILADIRWHTAERILRIPPGSSGYFLCGVISGYPVGAKLIHDGYQERRLSGEDAARMICFCNNASPAFVIGMLGAVFSSWTIGLAAWFVQILCAICTGCILPSRSTPSPAQLVSRKQSIQVIMLDILRSVGVICGWVILFKIILAYLHKWFLWLLPHFSQVFFSGMLELTNGLYMLEKIDSDALRFVTASVMLAFGGMCVLLQTHSVAPSFQISNYLLGKLMYCATAACISSLTALLLFGPEKILFTTALLSAVVTGLLTYLFIFKKKVVAFRGNIVYNHEHNKV